MQSWNYKGQQKYKPSIDGYKPPTRTSKSWCKNTYQIGWTYLNIAAKYEEKTQRNTIKENRAFG
ncbi:hypothetical protein I0600191H4_13610 [Collinsella sp. i06-0019-1H4]